MSLIADPHALLADYGRSVGLDDVGFDDDGEALLVFDAIAVRFLFDDERQLILISAPLVNREVEPDIDLYTRVLELNLSGILHGAGAVGLDTQDRALIFAHSISIIGLDQDRFNAFVEEGVALIEAWRGVIESGELLRPAGPQPQASALPMDDTVPTRV